LGGVGPQRTLNKMCGVCCGPAVLILISSQNTPGVW
jgi:hypothetical protein